MKKIFIIVLCFVLLNKATAQPDKVILDNVFQNIDKTTIPTGYLQDYGVAFVNKEAYNGVLTLDNYFDCGCHRYYFRFLKYSLLN